MSAKLAYIEEGSNYLSKTFRHPEASGQCDNKYKFFKKLHLMGYY